MTVGVWKMGTSTEMEQFAGEALYMRTKIDLGSQEERERALLPAFLRLWITSLVATLWLFVESNKQCYVRTMICWPSIHPHPLCVHRQQRVIIMTEHVRGTRTTKRKNVTPQKIQCLVTRWWLLRRRRDVISGQAMKWHNFFILQIYIIREMIFSQIFHFGYNYNYRVISEYLPLPRKKWWGYMCSYVRVINNYRFFIQ